MNFGTAAKAGKRIEFVTAPKARKRIEFVTAPKVRKRIGFCHSAEGAEYDSQGQALSGAKRVAPGKQEQFEESTESAK